MRLFLPLLLSLSLMQMLVACSSTPDYVLSEDDMAALLVDIHKGESYVDMHYNVYSDSRSDSLRKVLRQSILRKHNVSQDLFDTSLVWYGHHIDTYIEVYDEVIKRLDDEDKQIVAESRKAGSGVPMAAGDSIDLWNSSPVRILSRIYRDSIMSFDIVPDDNFRPGDVFQWRFRMANPEFPIDAFVAIDYDDGIVTLTSLNDGNDNWKQFSLQSDTAKVIKRIYGFALYKPSGKEVLMVDSIQLVRTRINKNRYYYINRQQTFNLSRKK